MAERPKTHKERAFDVLHEVGEINPYNFHNQNRKSEYYIYNMGWLAGFLADQMRDDVILRRNFQKAIEQRKRQ